MVESLIEPIDRLRRNLVLPGTSLVDLRQNFLAKEI
jgi:hypothetical protein